MRPSILDEMRTRAPPGGSAHERTAAKACTLITTRLGSSHTVRAVEGGPRVPPLPPQVPRMAVLDVSVPYVLHPAMALMGLMNLCFIAANGVKVAS